ncbi:hypothetical protein ACC717_03855 [Rhizobium ruizarguesonis]|uniref:Uncharacterized protein n=1 Tax=Rhizobium ruizarguesonis TaxID=2081791 RepID=A0AB38I4E9_9HYPH|nr:hypothetical protein [Rhizobium ruizarguesonis]TBB66213.1 hypothetical protein ELH42_08595 [Rhizobium ruizarguesonis]TBB70605.1 hypothetical protein ELH45_08645 [Rhizobium ruizarguesonis]TBC15635.1 hypothetical protein ELH40_12210 [Rhizobium ruizarguesonis]
MTGIGIKVSKNFSAIGPDFNVTYYTRSSELNRICEGDEGLEAILGNVPVEAFRPTWRAEVEAIRGLLVSLPDPDGATVEILFDIQKGFTYGVTRAPFPDLITVTAASDILSTMPTRDAVDALPAYEMTQDDWDSLDGKTEASVEEGAHWRPSGSARC